MGRKLRARKTSESDAKTLVLANMPWQAQIHCKPAGEQDRLTTVLSIKEDSIGAAHLREVLGIDEWF